MSSDETFLWTSASNSNSDSEDGSTSRKFSEMKSEIKEDFVKNEVDEKYKKIKNKAVNENFIKDEHTSDLKIVKNENSKGGIGNKVLFNDSYLNLRGKEEYSSCFDDSDIPVKKKNKNKKRKDSLVELNNDDRFLDVSNNEDKITIEETHRDDPHSATEDSNYVKHKKKKKKRRSSGVNCNDSNISEITCNNFSDRKCIDENNSISENHFESNGGNVDELESTVRNLSKVSDLIQFEEYLDFNKSNDFNGSIIEANVNQKQIRRYLKKPTNLQPISPKTKLKDSTITDSDDVWLVKCPQDVDIMHLKDMPLSLSNKTNLKVGGKVYEYMVDNNNLRLPILTFHHQNEPVIKNLRTNGCIHLKNTVPKVHIPDKKKRSLENSGEFQEPIKLEREVSKKIKKRKLSSGTNSPIKSKRVKYDPDSTKTWDSVSNDFNGSIIEANVNQKQIRRYLKKPTNLQPISPKTKLKDSTITDSDDVWLVKCPQDVDIMHLKDIPLSLSNKTNLKVGGKVYEYMVDNNNLRLPILTFHHQNEPVIKNLRTNGCIHLKNTVPKVHIPDNEIMINDQTNFIPLPDTKCRHPLFGIHYKKLIKVPVEIAKRLHTDQELHSLAVQDNITVKKKKQKKKKRSLENSGEFQEPIKLEREVSKKIKKRKLSSGTNIPIKSKRVKYDPDSTKTWDSEKAIEENLFNF